MAKLKRKEVSFTVTREEARLIDQIARRGVVLLNRAGVPATFMDLSMDVTACHANGCPLRLAGLAEADDFNLVHDLSGIRNTLDRETGKLRGLFRPRFAR